MLDGQLFKGIYHFSLLDKSLSTDNEIPSFACTYLLNSDLPHG